MKENLQRLGIRSENNDFRDTTVESFRGCTGLRSFAPHVIVLPRTFVGTLLQLLVLTSQLSQVKYLDDSVKENRKKQMTNRVCKIGVS